MSLNYIAIGQRIKARRAEQDLSQSALSERIDKTPTYISYIENGIKSMSLDTFVAIANALDTSADELLGNCIEHNSESMYHDISACLAGCTVYERKVLLGLLMAAKDILRTNKRFLH